MAINRFEYHTGKKKHKTYIVFSPIFNFNPFTFVASYKNNRSPPYKSLYFEGYATVLTLMR